MTDKLPPLFKATFKVYTGDVDESGAPRYWRETVTLLDGPPDHARRHARRIIRRIWPSARVRFVRVTRDRKSEDDRDRRIARDRRLGVEV